MHPQLICWSESWTEETKSGKMYVGVVIVCYVPFVTLCPFLLRSVQKTDYVPWLRLAYAVDPYVRK